MRTPSMRRGALFAAMLIAIGTGACAQTQSQPSAEAQLCDSLDTFGDSLQTFAELDPATSSIEDVRTARATIAAAWDQVRADAANIAEADQDAVEAAWTNFSEAVDEIPRDEPIAEALATLDSPREEVRAAYEEMSNGVGCPPSGSPAADV